MRQSPLYDGVLCIAIEEVQFHGHQCSRLAPPRRALQGSAWHSRARGPAPGIGKFDSAFFVERETYKAPLGGARGLLWVFRKYPSSIP